MNIIYVSCLCSKKTFGELFKDALNMPGQQVQKYHRLLVEGLVNGNCVKITTISSYPITRSNCNSIYVRSRCEVEKDVRYNCLPTVNIPVVKNIFTLFASFFCTLKLCLQNKDSTIICDILNVSVSIGALLASKLAKVKSIGIVTDIPNFLTDNSKKTSLKINNWLMNSFDSYIFLTDAMKKVVNSKNKKSVVIEGQVDINMKLSQNTLVNKYNKKVVIYAGAIVKVYGIEYLVNAFIKANIDDCELHIYGDGDFQKDLLEICKINENIKYFGVKLNDYVVSAEMKASLLINPRPTDEEYTKYSFPSKNMEYMVSGTPLLTTKLPGMPEEYNKYVYLIEDETEDGLVQILKQILRKQPQDLHEFGLKAKDWVLREKNNVKQTEKIVKMIEKMQQ